MTDTITLTGLVATEPKPTVTAAGLNITNFRLASTQRRFDRSQNKWVDGDTNWYTISAFRQLAVNSAASINKGDRIVVTGRLRLRDWQTVEKSGMNIDIEADAIGHDLSWGTARWSRTSQQSAGGNDRSTDTDPSDGTDHPSSAERFDISSGSERSSALDEWAGSSRFSGSTGAAASSTGDEGTAAPSRDGAASVLVGEDDETPF